jgi:NAD-dependent SIR2 family protein deacetylase
MTKGCVVCKNNKPFDMPKQIIDAVKQNKLVVFAGAGISTETINAFPYSFFEEVCDFLDLADDQRNLSFPEVMALLTNQPNGRKDLINIFIRRLEYCKAFGQIENVVTKFHKELADIHQITEIITTNWDDFFEIFCHSLPIVTAKDFSLWDFPGRKVFKIHGSVNNVGTIIADTKDYKDCYKALRTGIIGSALKMMLATKTIVFCGYSLRDSDFIKIYEVLKKELGDVLPHAYIVTINESDDKEKNGLTIINTDATFFLHKLKEKLTEEDLLFDNNIYEYYYMLQYRFNEVHKQTADFYLRTNEPQVALCLSYQDGISDGLDRAIRLQNTGLYLCPDHMRSHIRSYKVLFQERIRQKRYWDAAYIEGYMNTLFIPFMPDKEKLHIPLFYIYGYKGDIKNFASYKRLVKGKSYSKSAEKKILSMMKDIDDQIPQHTAFLL